MLAARDGKQFPNGYITALVERTGKSKSELYYRSQFAEACPTEMELSNALESHPSWRDLTRSLKRQKDAADNTVSEPQPVPEGEYLLLIV